MPILFAKSTNPYTKPGLREKLKQRIISGSKGGMPGQWSARKAQLLGKAYQSAGGGYKKGGLKAPQRNLKSWTKQKWRTNSGRPSLATGERYLPDAAWKKLTPGQKSATNRLKRIGMRSGKQFVSNAKAAKIFGSKVRRRIR